MTTKEITNLCAETCAYMAIVHPDYTKLANRVTVKALHDRTHSCIRDVANQLYNYKDRVGRPASLLSQDVYDVMVNNYERINAVIDYSRDFNYDFFGFKTLERAYLLKCDNKIVERPQHMLMRCAIGIHVADLEAAFETYNLMSEQWFTHATPTLFNSGTTKPQMSSCFLLTMREDSIEGIYDTLKQTAVISKNAGGIGIAMHCIRASDSYIRGTNGYSNGLVPMLKVYNDTARYVDQGGGKRKGAFAVYLEPWHADVYEFLQLRKNNGTEENRARDLFYALWIPDLFMKRVEADQDWSLMCPNECPGLFECWGDKFEALYTQYEQEGRARKSIKARWLWEQIIDSQIETGTPYMLYKDACNRKSNQQNLGCIKSSNLCTEILEYTSKDEVAVCNLASISLSKFASVETKTFDYESLHRVTKRITKNLNRVIDRNYYPIEEAKNSNMRHRPIGIGVQGLADAFQIMGLAFESDEALKTNAMIFETIYHAAMQTSMEMAQVEGHYQSFPGSPLSEGKFQFDLWGVKPITERYDWELLRQQVVQHGARNSLLVAPMPTASTSQILGNNESFEPFTSNVYTRRVLSGEFIIVNKHLVRDLIKLGLWTTEIKNMIVANNGSVQAISQIPAETREIYKTIWEIKQKRMLDMAVARGPYICQSQSLNLYQENPQFSKMSAMHFHAWKQGLKTGQYYFRSRPARDAIKFTVNVDMLLQASDKGADQVMECLNTNNATKNMGKKRRAMGQKPASLETDGMKKPAVATTVVEASKAVQ